MIRLALALALLAAPLAHAASPAPSASPHQTSAGEWEADHSMRLGEHAYLEGDIHRALAHFRAAAEKDPRRAECRWRSAHCLVVYGRFREAVAELERARAIAPEDPRILNTLAVVQMRRGLNLEAARAAEQAVRFAPGVADVWDTLGWASLGAGNRERARVAFETAVRLDPHNRSAKRGLHKLLR
jgi:Flp pilus assembly protein TadD